MKKLTSLVAAMTVVLGAVSSFANTQDSATTAAVTADFQRIHFIESKLVFNLTSFNK